MILVCDVVKRRGTDFECGMCKCVEDNGMIVFLVQFENVNGANLSSSVKFKLKCVRF